MVNIIRIQEGAVSVPYVVHQRFGENAKIKPGPTMRLIREQRGVDTFLLLCEQIQDAVWVDIPSDEETKRQPNAKSKGQTDTEK